MQKLGENLDLEIDPIYLDDLKRLSFSSSFLISNDKKINTWQGLLENGHSHEFSSSRRHSKYVTHGIHQYKGKFYPQLVKSIFNISQLKEGAKVLDPFCGSGTVILEAYLNGLEGYGCDFNPLAIEITKSKIGILNIDPADLKALVKNFIFQIDHGQKGFDINYFNIECRLEVLRWFPAKVIEKLAYLIAQIKTIDNVYVRQFFLVILSSIVRNISQQDPKDLRIRRRKELITDAPVIDLYKKNLQLQCEKILKFHEIRHYYSGKFLQPIIWKGDSRYLDNYNNHSLKNNEIDAVVTSPPYATALPYIDTDRLSLLTIFNLPSYKRNSIDTELIGSRVKKLSR
jgi:SAM-dependent methyltransferase